MRVEPIANILQSGYVAPISNEKQRSKKLRRMMKKENISFGDLELDGEYYMDAKDVPAGCRMDKEVDRRLMDVQGVYNNDLQEIPYTPKGMQVDRYS
ncbi:MAG: hypothetical protein IJ327_07920 [Lachnospiraceae bacterium]|nr:hypothetical protein [Lachnospiraceae bacterium]